VACRNFAPCVIDFPVDSLVFRLLLFFAPREEELTADSKEGKPKKTPAIQQTFHFPAVNFPNGENDRSKIAALFFSLILPGEEKKEAEVASL